MNDIREYITLVEGQELDEAGGMIDKLMSKLPGGIGARAGGKVDKKEMFKLLKKTWIRYAASKGADEKDSEGIKDFLRSASLTDQQIDQIDELKKRQADLNDVFDAAAEFVNANAGPEFSPGDTRGKLGREKKVGRDRKTPTVAATGSSPEDMKTTFRKLGGNQRALIGEVREVRNIGDLRDTPLAMLGYLYIQEDKKRT